RTEVVVGRNRAGPPGRRATIRILYADGGERDACLRLDGLLVEAGLGLKPTGLSLEPTVNAPAIPVPGNRNHATAASLSPASRPPPRIGAGANPGRPAASRDCRDPIRGDDRGRGSKARRPDRRPSWRRGGLPRAAAGQPAHRRARHPRPTRSVRAAPDRPGGGA